MSEGDGHGGETGERRLGLSVRFREAVRRILAEHGTPAELGLSVALGAFVACTPFYGIQTLLALGLAWALRLNRVAAILAAQVSIAPVSPFLIFASIQLGELVLHGHFFAVDLAMLRARTFGQVGGLLLGAWFVGGCLLGVLVGSVLGTATWLVALARGRTPSDRGARAAIQRAASRYRNTPPTVRLYARIKYFVDPGYLRAAEVVAALEPARCRTILDLGCGVGMLAVLLADLRPDSDVAGVDWDREKLERARAASSGLANVRFAALDLRTDAVPAAECAVLMDVLHYHPPHEQDALLARVAAALTPLGTLLVREADADHHHRAARLFERLAAGIGWHRTAGRFHYRSAAALVETLESLGFRVRVVPAGDLVHRANLLLVATRVAAGAGDLPGAPGAVLGR